jgi:long-subunit acyl-CoA synthetase (AMP-forming)
MNAILSALAERARRAPSQLAIAGGECLSNAALYDGARRLADRLLALGVRRIAAELDNGSALAMLELACRIGDLVLLQLPAFFSAAQRRHTLADAGIDALVSPRGGIELPGGLRLDRFLDATDVPLPPGTATITYTSGSTGAPKGVCLSGAHLDAVAGALVAALAPRPPQRHLALLPQSVLLESVAGIGAGLLAGAELVIPSLAEIGWSGAAGIDPGALARCIDRAAPESLILVPQMLAAWLAAIDAGAPVPGSLRFCAVGGARVGNTLLARAAALGLPVYEGYGLSECASVLCLNVPGAARPGSVGRPLGHIALHIDDGEVHVAGPRMLGYVGADAPHGPRWATGDLGRFDDEGYLYLDGRRGNRFITAFGRNVSPEWVEGELTDHPAIAQAFVYGEACAENTALIVPRDSGLSDAALDAAVRSVNAGLPDYARAHRWVRAETFSFAAGELTANGRLRRGAIVQRYRDRLGLPADSSVDLEFA